MITLLGKLFIHTSDPMKQRKYYGTLCSITGIVLNIFLFLGKYLAGVLSGSIAITADAFNNLSDAGSSFITLIGFLFSGKKPDLEHPFGHGRFEYISGFIVSLAILLMGVELFKSSVGKIIHPEAVDSSPLALAILLASILVKLYMAIYNHTYGQRFDSAAMKATATDSLSDMVSTSVVLISMLALQFFHWNIDGFCGLFVAIFILYAGLQASKETLDPLLGLAPDPDFVQKVEELVLSYPLVEGIHDLIVHDYGPGRLMLSLHAEVPGDEDIFLLHDEIDQIEHHLRQTLNCEAVIHMDPIETNNEEVNKNKNLIAEKLKKIHPDITIHDFRMVMGYTHSNVIFDAVIPFELELSPKEIREKISTQVKEINPTFETVVTLDAPYTKK